MSIVLADRVKVRARTTGTGDFTLESPVDGFRSFAVIGSGNQTYYGIVNVAGDWEIGLGRYETDSSEERLIRQTVLSSSNNNQLVNFPPGGKNVYSTFPAEIIENVLKVVPELSFYVAADDSSSRIVSGGETVKFSGSGNVSTSTDAEGNITITDTTTPTFTSINNTGNVAINTASSTFTFKEHGRIDFTSDCVAVGLNANLTNPNGNTVAVGSNAGRDNQGTASVALGSNAAVYDQAMQSVAVGYAAAEDTQSQNAVAVGAFAGQTRQGENAVAIGAGAGYIDQPTNSIMINASGGLLNGSNSGLYIDPIRTSETSTALYYNSSTKEITSGPSYSFNVAADDSTQRLIASTETIKFIGAGLASTSSDAEGNITITAAEPAYAMYAKNASQVALGAATVTFFETPFSENGMSFGTMANTGIFTFSTSGTYEVTVMFGTSANPDAWGGVNGTTGTRYNNYFAAVAGDHKGSVTDIIDVNATDTFQWKVNAACTIYGLGSVVTRILFKKLA